MKKLLTGITTILASVLSAIFIIGAAYNPSRPASPDLSEKLTNLARKAYTIQMDATLNINRPHLEELNKRLADYYSSTPQSATIISAKLPASRNTNAQEDTTQQAKLEATLRQKGIDPQQNAAFQAAQMRAEEFRKLPAIDRVRHNLRDGLRGFDESNMTVEGWGLDDFKVISVQTQGSTATLVAEMHVWSRFRHVAPDGQIVVNEPHNGLRHTFYFQKEGDNWKIFDWEFEFLPGEGP